MPTNSVVVAICFLWQMFSVDFGVPIVDVWQVQLRLVIPHFFRGGNSQLAQDRPNFLNDPGVDFLHLKTERKSNRMYKQLM